MYDISFRPRRFVWTALVAESTPKQIAWGIALGALIGFVPKGNLLAIGLAAVLFSLRVNLLAALVTITACSLVGALLDPLFDHLGRTILTIMPLQDLFARVYQWPFVPWTEFNNTVVMGAFFAGALQLYPTYRLARRLSRQRGNAWVAMEVQEPGRGVVVSDAT